MRESSATLPTVFVSHGSPMHALEAGAAGRAWAALGARLGRPCALLIASAHWETDSPALTGAARPETIHDFYGFPDALYRIRYLAPGDPQLAARAQALLRESGLDAAVDPRRGLDHGAWSPLLYAYPRADVPVVQVSVQTPLGPRHHLALGRALERLADYRRLMPHGARAHPSEEHFLPLFVALGAASEDYRAERLLDHVEGGVLAMDAWLFHLTRTGAPG
jgi:4,5-DOPA dioxygenase extradiol